MKETDNASSDAMREKTFKNHVQGAIVRAAGSLIMWMFAVFSFLLTDELPVSNFVGITCSVLFLAFIIPLTLFILIRITHYSAFSIFINMLDVVGYTAVIYSLGGFEATYLTPIYAALITYWGVMAPPKVPYIIASFCSFAFASLLVLEGLGIIPSLKTDPNFEPSIAAQFVRVSVIIVLLFIIAYISSFTAGKLKQARDRIRQKNMELEDNAIQLENSQNVLKQKNEDLQDAINEIETLKGIIPICSNCKNVRDDKGYWNQIESYIRDHSGADFSHSICPKCCDELYGKEDWYVDMKKEKK
jgi:ABC-type multidrug transport system fused ATPase/permease subunit